MNNLELMRPQVGENLVVDGIIYRALREGELRETGDVYWAPWTDARYTDTMRPELACTIGTPQTSVEINSLAQSWRKL